MDTIQKKQESVIYGDDLPITTFQINTINRNCNWNVDIKEEWVQWATGDVNRTSLKSLTQAQAVKIIRQQSPLAPEGGTSTSNSPLGGWGAFDKNNKQHYNLLSQLRTLQWTIHSEKWGEVADLERLSNFLKSDKSPVQKPLKQMDPGEVSKVIEAFKSMVRKMYK